MRHPAVLALVFVSAAVAGCSKESRSREGANARVQGGPAGAKDECVDSRDCAARAEKLLQRACDLGDKPSCARLDHIEITMPRARPSSGDVESIFEVDLAADGSLLANGLAVTPDKLRAAMADAVRTYPHIQLVLHAAPTIAHGRVVEVMDVAKQVGITSLTFAVPSPTPQSP